MIALIQALRRQGKLALTMLFLDTIFLLVCETIIVAFGQALLHPWVAGFGLCWIVTTVLAIWIRGGVVVDGLIIARIVGQEVGKIFTHALVLFFWLQFTIVSALLVIPVWYFWPGYLAALVFITVLLLTGNLAGRKFNWNRFYSAYGWILFAVFLSIFIIAGYEWLSGKTVTDGAVKEGLRTISSSAANGLCGVKGAAKDTLKKKLTATSVPKLSKTTKTFRPQGQTYPPVTVEPGQVTDTGIHYKAGDLLTFGQIGEPSRFYVVGSRGDREILTKNYSGRGLGPTDENTTVWLRGGEQPTTVAITVTRS